MRNKIINFDQFWRLTQIMDSAAVYSVSTYTRYFDLNGKRYVSFTLNPNDNKDAYFYGESLKCDVVSYKRYLFQMGYRDHIAICKSYLRGAILKFLYNNFDLVDSLDELSSVFRIWILSWKDNIGMERNGIDQLEYTGGYCAEIWGSTKKEIVSKMDRDTITTGFHWYPLSVEFIQDVKVRRVEKEKCRSTANKNRLRDCIEDISQCFSVGSYDILPTVKDISSILGHSESVIRSHGEGLFISASEQKLQLLRFLMDEKPNPKPKEIETEMNNLGVGISLSHLKKLMGDIKNGRY